MRLTVIAPGHVLLVHRPPQRWVLLAMAAVLSWPSIYYSIEFGFAGPMLIGTVLCLLLGIGGVYALICKDEVEIDASSVRYLRRRPLGGGELYAERAAVGAVRLSARIVAGKETHQLAPRMSYEVELLCPRTELPRAITLYRHHREPKARHFAEALCRAGALAFVDATGERGEYRAPDQLDGPPPMRSALPAGELPAGIATHPDPIHGEVATAHSWTGARVTVYLADDELVLARSWCSVPLRTRRLPRDDVSRVRVQSRAGASQHLQKGVAVVAGGKALLFGSWLRPAQRRWLAAWIESRLWPHLPEVTAVA